MTGQEHWACDERRPSGSWITQADRAQWQRQAARELVKILGEWAELPAITWTITPGGHLTGHVGKQADLDGGRVAFTAWQLALRMEDVQEVEAGDGSPPYLRASVARDGVRATIIATVADLPGGTFTTRTE